MEKPGPFQIEATIAVVHCRAKHADDTDWKEIAALYETLEAFRPIPTVRVNRAFAAARAEGPAAGLALLDERTDVDASGYPYFHLVRGTLLGELGRIEEAQLSMLEADRHARNASERVQIRAQIEALGGSGIDGAL